MSEPSRGFSPVELMTMAGAKGLSADHVIILGGDPINMQHATVEVFYVALTRARRSLHTLVVLGAKGASDPHPYVLALPEAHCDYLKFKADGPESFAGRRDFENYFRGKRSGRYRPRSVDLCGSRTGRITATAMYATSMSTHSSLVRLRDRPAGLSASSGTCGLVSDREGKSVRQDEEEES